MPLLLLLLLLCACSAPPRGLPPDLGGLPRARLRYLPAQLPADGGYAPGGSSLPGFHPQAVGPGPLFFFRQDDRLSVLDRGKVRVLSDQAGKLRLLERLDADHLLVELEQLGVLELSTGRLAMLPAGRETLVSLEGNRLYLLVDGFLQVDGHRLGTHPVTTLLDEDREAFFLLSGDEVYRLAKTGAEQKLGSCPIPPGASLSLSPDRRRLAVGVPGGELRVYELASGKLLRQVQGIDVKLSKLASREPPVSVGWMDDHTLRYSVSEHTTERDPEFYSERARTPEGYFRWRDLDVESGADRLRQRYARLGLRHAIPGPEVVRPERDFHLDDIELWVPKKRVLQAVLSPAGDQAVVQENLGPSRGTKLTLLDVDGHPTELASGRGIRRGRWLAGVGEVPWAPPEETGQEGSRLFPGRTLRFFARERLRD